MHLDVRRSVGTELRRRKDESKLAQDDLTSGLADFIKRLTKKWSTKFDGIAGDIAKKFVDAGGKYTESAMMSSLRDAGFTVKFKMTGAAREGYGAVIQENVGLIRSIPEQYLTQVQGDVWRCVSQGYDLESLTKTLQDRYGSTRKRAELIARDQTNKAKAAIESVRRKELGITTAIWQHSGAGKHPRPEHVAANGKEFDVNKGLYLEGEWVLPGYAIGCRCTSRSVLRGFND